MTKRRNTTAKTTILELLARSPRALSQEAIARKMDLETNRTTIYRILNQFCEDGLAHRVVADDGKQYFTLCGGCGDKKMPRHHFHFRCTRCGSLECLEQPVRFSLPEGYALEGMNCLLSGSCRSCSAKVTDAPAP